MQLPVMGVCEVVGGRLVSWLDYFHLTTSTKPFG